MQERIVFHLRGSVTTGEVSDWRETVRVILLRKDKSKENKESNYRPITCLPLM